MSTLTQEANSSVRRRGALLASCQQGLAQCEAMLQTLSAADYCRQSDGLSSIGAHLRHILDRYHCVFAGLARRMIDYDSRQRDRTVELNKEAAAFAIASLQRRLHDLDVLKDGGETSAELIIRESVDPRAAAIDVPSTLERELMGLVSHTVHHLAIIAMMLRQLGYQPGENFGKAASTIAFENR